MKPIKCILADENRFGKRASVRQSKIMETIIYQPIFDIFFFTDRLKKVDFLMVCYLAAANNQTNRGTHEKL